MGWETPYNIGTSTTPGRGRPYLSKPRILNRDGAIQKRIDPIMRRDDMKVHHWGQG